MKKNRQERILELIESQVIDTQEDLQTALRQSGYEVTQATISRDVKELHIVKATDAAGRYRYTAHREAAPRKVAYHDIFESSVISIDSAMNDVIIKCHIGMAQGACAALDSMKWNAVVGTLAGDDTILAVTRSEEDAIALVKSLKRLIDKG